MVDIVALAGTAGDWQVELLYREDEQGTCWMSMRLPQFDITKCSDYRSLSEASANLACTVGTSAATACCHGLSQPLSRGMHFGGPHAYT